MSYRLQLEKLRKVMRRWRTKQAMRDEEIEYLKTQLMIQQDLKRRLEIQMRRLANGRVIRDRIEDIITVSVSIHREADLKLAWEKAAEQLREQITREFRK